MSRGFGASFAAENQLSHSFQQLESDTLSEHGGAASSSSRRIDSRGASAFSRGRDDAGSGMDIHEDDLLAEFRPVKDTLNKVNWSGMALTSLPVFKSNQLEAQVMWINNNKIVALPTSIKMLSNLRTLRLDDNQIQIIPGFLASCRWLECLTAKRNKIHQISLDVFDLQNIKVLDFEENSLTVLPEVHNFHLLERLSVTKNRLTKLPSSIGSCSRLKSLYADNNRIQQLMFTFEQLTDLQLLNIAHNEISAVHSSIGCCLSLEVLHLHYNHLITLPYTVGLLSNLSRLTIHDNPSVSVPKQVIAAGTDIAVDFLKKMLDANESKQIWLNNMHLITVPLPNVSQVQEFVVWKRIRVLNLDRNELHNLPVELCVLDELEVLSVEHNMLTTVTPTLMQLSRLQVLAVGNNRIQSLPQSLKKLIQLEELLFETNCLTVVPTMLPSLISLTDLRFDNNRIASLPPELGNLQMLQILSFQNNVVDSIPPSFTSLHRLAYLRCGSNKIADVRSLAQPVYMISSRSLADSLGLVLFDSMVRRKCSSKEQIAQFSYILFAVQRTGNSTACVALACACWGLISVRHHLLLLFAAIGWREEKTDRPEEVASNAGGLGLFIHQCLQRVEACFFHTVWRAGAQFAFQRQVSSFNQRRFMCSYFTGKVREEAVRKRTDEQGFGRRGSRTACG